MDIQEWNWQTSDGLPMYSKDWKPEGKPKAVVCLVQGLGEHIDRYEHVAAALTSKGYVLSGFDLRGHGKSGGPRGHTPSYDALMDDIAKFLDKAEKHFPDLPCFLYGHSLGGNLILNYPLLRKSTLAGVISTGPWIKLSFQPPASKIGLAKIMNGILPGFSQPNGLETAALSRLPEVVTAYVNDPLVHDRISARMFLTVYEAGLWALEHASEIKMPILIMHGGADRITSPEASREFAEKAGEQVTLHIWEGLYHEIHNEPEQADVFKVMVEWLDSQINKSCD